MRSDLTPEERAVVGEPGDLVDEGRVSPRSKSTSVMFSVRVDRATFEAISDIAEEKGLRFSEVVRDALRRHVDQEEIVMVRLLEEIAIKVDAIAIVSVAAGSDRALPTGIPGLRVIPGRKAPGPTDSSARLGPTGRRSWPLGSPRLVNVAT